MLTSSIQSSKRKLQTMLTGALMLLAFLLLGTEQVAAQSYVTPAEATLILKAEGSALYVQLLNETPGSTNYNQLFSKVHYYEAVRQQLEAGGAVQQAVEQNKASVCHPSTVADCKSLPETQVIAIVEETKILLSN